MTAVTVPPVLDPDAYEVRRFAYSRTPWRIVWLSDQHGPVEVWWERQYIVGRGITEVCGYPRKRDAVAALDRLTAELKLMEAGESTRFVRRSEASS